MCSFSSAVPPIPKRSKDRKKKKLKSTIQASTSQTNETQTCATKEIKSDEIIDEAAGTVLNCRTILRIFTLK
jgi:hypothetical protein